MSRRIEIRASLGIIAGAILSCAASHEVRAEGENSSLSYTGIAVREGVFGTDPLAPQTSLDRDYDLSYRPGDGSGRFTMFDLKHAEGRGTLSSSFAGSVDASAPVLTRLDSSWTTALPGTAAKFRVGDGISDPGSWGRAVRFGGVQLGTRSVSARTDLVTTSMLGQSGAAFVPSTADLFLQSARAPQLQPLNRPIVTAAPTVTGNGLVSLALQDPFGRTRSLTQPLLANTSLVQRGHSDYSVELGRVREDYALDSNRYGDWFASTTLRYGLSKSTTIEGHAAQLNENSVYGIDIAKQLDTANLLSAAYASSRDAEASGWLAKVGIEHRGPTVTLALKQRLQSSGFREFGNLPGVDDIQRRTLASASMKLGAFGNVGIAGATQVSSLNQHEDLYALTHSMSLGSFGQISTSAGYSSDNFSSVLFSFVHSFSTTQPAAGKTMFDLNDWSLAARGPLPVRQAR